jgi:hypothetical protein
MSLIDGFNSKMMGEDFCLADSATTHTIFKDKKYFQQLSLSKAYVNTISGSLNLIEGSRRANIMLPKGTKLYIDDALYSSKSRRNLLSLKDIRHNGYHIETNNKGSEEYLYITSMVSGQKLILEKLPIFSSRLYYTTMKTIETNVILRQKYSDPNIFILWHNRLGHLGSIMMRRIIENSYGHPLKNQKILLLSDYPCSACSQGKLIIKPSLSKIAVESLSFLERIQGDICGPIYPPCGPFMYFMVLIDASTRWSHDMNPRNGIP